MGVVTAKSCSIPKIDELRGADVMTRQVDVNFSFLIFGILLSKEMTKTDESRGKKVSF